MQSFWNERYSAKEYAYGKEPNVFFKEELFKLNVGNLLLPGEGEGRNAVHAAKLGWNVTAFDYSEVAKRKAELLATEQKVNFNYFVGDFNSTNIEHNFFDCIALIFVHPPKDERHILHQKTLSYLKPGGTLILEGFSKEQIDYDTGGPKNIEMLFSEEELYDDFSELKEINLNKTKTHLKEGPFHNGMASTIRVIGKK